MPAREIMKQRLMIRKYIPENSVSLKVREEIFFKKKGTIALNDVGKSSKIRTEEHSLGKSLLTLTKAFFME